MIKFREHRGTLADAMKTVVELADIPALEAHVRQTCPGVTDVDIAPYDSEPDRRIGWENTFIVTNRESGRPIGWCEIVEQ